MKDLVSKLGIVAKSKVCMIRPQQEALSKIRQNADNVEITINRIERGCDVVLYWVESADDIGQKMREIQSVMRPNGKIWVIMPKKESSKKMGVQIDWKKMQEEIMQETHLVDNKLGSF